MENKMTISSSDLSNIISKSCEMGRTHPYGCDVGWLGYTIHIKHVLDFAEMMSFVNGVVSGCFAKSDNHYMPEVRDFYLRYFIVESYTNIELPDSIEEKNQVLYGSNLVDTVLCNVDMGQYHAIVSAIDKKIAYFVNANVKQITDEVNLVSSHLNKLYDDLSETFSGIDRDTITSIANAISGGVIDEKKLVEAVIAARDKDVRDDQYQKDVKQND